MPLMRIPPATGRTLHETLFDPQAFRLQIKKEFNLASKQEFSGQAPGLFVGRHGYPQVRVGLLATPHYESHDDPLAWVRNKASLAKIVGLRSQLVNAHTTAHVKLPSGSLPEKVRALAQEAAMAIKPVDMDVSLEQKPLFRLSLQDEAMPHGPVVGVKRAELTSNPKVPTFVEKVVEDTDLLASGGIGQLWHKGLGEHKISQLLSAGTLGQQLQRHLVPTRWGITAVDDTVGKSLHKQVLDNPEADFMAFFGGYMGNYFLVLCLPQPWSFELFENYVGGQGPVRLTTGYTDYEGVRGRSDYAHNTAGGYYAARLGVLEKLVGLKRQAGVVALRFITDEYWAPLGVWVVREAMRAALSQKSLVFDSWERLRAYASSMVGQRFGADIVPVLAASRLLAERRSQTTLRQFS